MGKRFSVVPKKAASMSSTGTGSETAKIESLDTPTPSMLWYKIPFPLSL